MFWDDWRWQSFFFEWSNSLPMCASFDNLMLSFNCSFRSSFEKKTHKKTYMLLKGSFKKTHRNLQSFITIRTQALDRVTQLIWFVLTNHISHLIWWFALSLGCSMLKTHCTLKTHELSRSFQPPDTNPPYAEGLIWKKQTVFQIFTFLQ